MIAVENLTKIYNKGESNELYALKDVSFNIEEGEFCVILGPSGSGKSTLLKSISGLDKFSSGSVMINNKEIATFTEKEFNKFKRNEIGFIFQEYNLIDDLTLLENITLNRAITNEIESLIDKWGLKKAIHLFPKQSSGGQQQKAAILRALLKDAKVLFCDEPTGALDGKSSEEVLKVLQTIQKDLNTTIILITHNELIRKIANKILTIHDGKLVKVEVNENVLLANEVEW